MSEQYDKYLKEHIKNVETAFIWLIDNNIVSIDAMGDASHIYEHDASKYSVDEYDPYDNYFYKYNTYNTEKLFDYAWIHHIHNNPHHWQYWVLLEDNPKGDKKYKVLRMPYKYVVEMVCDWWSFSWSSGNLYSIFDWYEDHKYKMKLHDATKDDVETILSGIKKVLDDKKANYENGNIDVASS